MDEYRLEFYKGVDDESPIDIFVDQRDTYLSKIVKFQ